MTSENLVTPVLMVWMAQLVLREALALPDSPVLLEIRVLRVLQVLRATPVRLDSMVLPARTENPDPVGRMEKWVHPVNRVNKGLLDLAAFVVNVVLPVTRASMVNLVMTALLVCPVLMVQLDHLARPAKLEPLVKLVRKVMKVLKVHLAFLEWTVFEVPKVCAAQLERKE